jgi:putative salt-induced outer membrane protein YdiY
VALVAPAMADVVRLKNGDRLTGTLDGISGKRLILQTEYAGKLTLKLNSVLTVQTEKAFDLKLRDGTRTSGRLVVADEAQALLDADAEQQPLALEQVKKAGQNRLAMVDLASDWSSRADLSVAISTGNSETEAYNGLIESALKRERSEHALSLLISQEKAEGETTESETTKDQLELDYGYKRFFAEKWFGAGNAEYFEDGLKDVDYRITAGAGVGYQFWDDSFGALSAELGANVVVEQLDGVSEENPALRWALKYNRHLWSKRVEVFHDHSLLVIPDRGEVIDSSTGIRMAVNHRIDTNLRIDVQHETEPAVDSEKTDVTYALGVGIKF